MVKKESFKNNLFTRTLTSVGLIASFLGTLFLPFPLQFIIYAALYGYIVIIELPQLLSTHNWKFWALLPICPTITFATLIGLFYGTHLNLFPTKLLPFGKTLTPVKHIFANITLFSPLFFILFVPFFIFDTFAYLGGNLFGKTPLAKKISPHKTWEGFFSGLCAIAVSFYIIFEKTQFLKDMPTKTTFFKSPLVASLLIALLFSCAATTGDLFFSYLKRKNNLKHTGTLLPGHGGLLDRFDSLFIGLPLVYSIIASMFLFSIHF